MKQLTNNSFSKQKGFTLIELVVVIVILGILAATAAPKFIDLTGDARTSVMKGVQGSINTAVNLAHAKALVEAQTGITGEILIGEENYALVHGFPAAVGAPPAEGTAEGDIVPGSSSQGFGVGSLIKLESGSDITPSEVEGTTVFTHSGATDPTLCTITYTNAEGPELPPGVALELKGC